ncbi:conserved exported hypothetical protein [Paraburkholderia piptadeniae]|uniref:DUF4148 domain-containing protein n=1 Tax=Paraburkholderia piptadeniae TaxID=1701573 RepID=A0A1N7SVZ6_9BURK|nr:DUF4148 domain-containing protein [Paraburkholderia piptadeniae]SIT51648.1 conserved exported hypothetical protein [Paraburkholderia piptadeniae]
MKLIPRMVLGALVGAVCVSSALAQTSRVYDQNKPKTRAEVKADLIEWRNAGYDPLDWIDYPANAIAAGRIVAQRRAQAQGVQQ